MKIEGLSSNLSFERVSVGAKKNDVSLQETKKSPTLEQQQNEQTETKLTREDAKHIVKGLNEFLKPHLKSFNFELHDESNRFYVQVVDQETKEVLREIPERELLDVYAKMSEYLGLFIDEKL